MNHITDSYSFYEWPEISSFEANLKSTKGKLEKLKAKIVNM